jgi:HD superfamily phosphohydrolase YqeK
LIAADKVYLADAIDNTHVDNWVNKRGQSQNLDQKVINCVSQNVIVTLQKKPQANHLPDFYKDAVAACKSQ